MTLALVAVAVPLTSASIRSAGRAQVSQTVNQTIVTWLIPYPSLTVDAVTIAGVDVRVQLSGPVAPPPTSPPRGAVAELHEQIVWEPAVLTVAAGLMVTTTCAVAAGQGSC